MSDPASRTSISRRFDLCGTLDRRRLEALALAVRRLAREHNIEIDTLEITAPRPEDPPRAAALTTRATAAGDARPRRPSPRGRTAR
jgi:hypothetical protein